MRITVMGERRIRVAAQESELLIESEDPGIGLTPLHMLAASLATCSLEALMGWAEQAALSTDIEIELWWEYVEEPFRVGRYDMIIRWPELTAERRVAALRVVKQCTVEHTLRHPPAIQARLV